MHACSSDASQIRLVVRSDIRRPNLISGLPEQFLLARADVGTAEFADISRTLQLGFRSLSC